MVPAKGNSKFLNLETWQEERVLSREGCKVRSPWKYFLFLRLHYLTSFSLIFIIKKNIFSPQFQASSYFKAILQTRIYCGRKTMVAGLLLAYDWRVVAGEIANFAAVTWHVP